MLRTVGRFGRHSSGVFYKGLHNTSSILAVSLTVHPYVFSKTCGDIYKRSLNTTNQNDTIFGGFGSPLNRKNTTILACSRPFVNSATKGLKIAVVGAGPAGFYTAGPILREIADSRVDFFEAQPVPFGLVRYGVAPDHPEVKNCIRQFEDSVEKSRGRIQFFGGVKIGRDVNFSRLRNVYDVIILACGAPDERPLAVKNSATARNTFSARQFVGWYNGLPENASLDPILTGTDTAVVLGHGNVALDVSRILLTPLDILRKTDAPEFVLEALSKSEITVGEFGSTA